MRLPRLPILLLAIVLAGCGQAAAPAGGGPVRAADLVGTWTVTDAASATPSTTVVFNPGDFELRSGEDVRSGSWRAAPGAFVAEVNSASGPDPVLDSPGWLTAAARADADGANAVLVDRAGAVTARLVPVAKADAPLPATAAPAALPAGLTPAGAPSLIGRWVPADGAGAASPKPAGVTFAPDGHYTGSDGCNATAGRWAAGDGGLLLATSGPMTLMGCADMVAVPSWVGGAGRAGFDGPTLVLVDASGAELGRLRPATA